MSVPMDSDAKSNHCAETGMLTPEKPSSTQDDGGGGKEYEIEIRRYDHLGDEEYRSDD